MVILNSVNGIGPSTGLPLDLSDDPNDVFYTTNEPLQSLPFLEEVFSGPDVYKVDDLVRQINDEVRFPRQRLPRDFYVKMMRQINTFLPPCTNEKCGHEFKHKRIRIDRTMKQKLANRPREVLTSECVHCKRHWSGLKYPLMEDPNFPERMSLYCGRHSTKSQKPAKMALSRISTTTLSASTSGSL